MYTYKTYTYLNAHPYLNIPVEASKYDIGTRKYVKSDQNSVLHFFILGC